VPLSCSMLESADFSESVGFKDIGFKDFSLVVDPIPRAKDDPLKKGIFFSNVDIVAPADSVAFLSVVNPILVVGAALRALNVPNEAVVDGLKLNKDFAGSSAFFLISTT